MPVSDKIAVQVDGRELILTNLSKVLYQVDGFTKAEVLDYYQRISAVLLPHVAGRPMTLKRYPNGVDGQSFFAKHAVAGRPDWVRTEEIVSRSSRSRALGEPIEYVVIDEGSENGTFAAATRLSRQAPHTLANGDLLRFGRVWVEVRLDGAAEIGRAHV